MQTKDALAMAQQAELAIPKTHYITCFYHFKNVVNPELIKTKLLEFAKENNLRGLVVLGDEGINSTSSAPTLEVLEEYKKFVLELMDLNELNFKDSKCETPPFKKFQVKIRKEIVTLGKVEITVDKTQNHHLNSEDWNKALLEEDTIVIDTRNWYETKIGTFKKALTPGIDKFTEFCDWVDNQNFDKSKKMLIFCTGGIRCEKGIYEMQKRGYDNVYQLEGGILKYLAEKPSELYEGECFVFDHRVAVDQNLQPTTKYKLCPHCGQPGEKVVTCKRCDSEQVVCNHCLELDYKKDTCSKNCAYQYQLHPDRKAKKQFVPRY